jgi:toxin-antitoxin system PIN domain toxin
VSLVDANVLLYAVNTDARHHRRSRRWLDQALSGGETVAFAWIALLAFVRLSTKAGLFPSPLSADQALDRVDAWLAAPAAVVVHPTADHGRIVRRLLRDVGVGGNLVNDAHLAALAIEHRRRVVSFDNDFARFGVAWSEPDPTA